MARRLAGWGCDLLITARRGERLAALAGELHSTHGVSADWIALDLAEPGSAQNLFTAAYAHGGDVDILINNAGFGEYQYFLKTPWQRHAEMIWLNVMAPVELTYRFLQVMAHRGRRTYILNTSSIVSLIPMPYYANYGATKAYIQFFTEALAAELKGTNISITSLCAGSTETEFNSVAGRRPNRLASLWMMDADRVATIGLLAMLDRKRNVVPGAINRLAWLCSRYLPPAVAGAVVTKLQGKPTTLPR